GEILQVSFDKQTTVLPKDGGKFPQHPLQEVLAQDACFRIKSRTRPDDLLTPFHLGTPFDQAALTLIGSYGIDDRILSDGSQPCFEPCLAPEVNNTQIGAAEDFLGQLFAIDLPIRAIGYPCADECAQWLPLLFVKRSPGFGLAAAQGLQELRCVQSAFVRHNPAPSLGCS